jgi:UDP-2,4-diacetamido-2,4,6-trideoxy-beta-L-altropyranose hydrolase
MNIAFRTDASNQIGTGHFMRCLTLATALKAHGVRIRFVSRNLPEYLRNMLAEKNMEFAALSNEATMSPTCDLAHSNWLDASQAMDAQATVNALSDQPWDWLVVDHYALDSRWESALRVSTKKIMVIDDIADRQHDCDVLLDQNFYVDMQTRYTNKVPTHCQQLLGPHYALLRDEFQILRENVKPRTGLVKNILVFFGGIDAGNYTGLAIKILAELPTKSFKVDVVIGTQHPNRTEIETNCTAQGFVCHVQTDRMAELMATADLAIGAGGSATWERCCLGLPALSICVASNQQRQIADAAEEGLLYAPSSDGDLVVVLKRHVTALLENAPLLKMISNTAMRAVDGRGALRVIRKLGYTDTGQSSASNITVRLAVADDAALVWPWRNNESTRRYFFDSSPVSLDAHLEWWSQSLSDLKRVLLLGKLDGKEVGVIRYDLVDSRHAKVSIYLNPEMTGRGLGECLLRSAQNWLLQNHPEVKTISAEIMAKNIASLRVFLAAGFQEQHIAMSWEGC